MGKLNLKMIDTMLEKENTSTGTTQGEFTYDKLLDGKNIRRVLWPKGNKDMFFQDGYYHYRVGSEQKTVVCPSTVGKPCPICQKLYALKDSPNPEDVEAYNSQKRKRRIAINVLDRSEKDPKPKILIIGATILKGILSTISDPDYGDITDAETGRDITITRSGKGLTTSYTVLAKPNPSKVENVEEVENDMADLDRIFTLKSDEEMMAIANTIGSASAIPTFNPTVAEANTSSDTSEALRILGKLTTK